MVVVMAAAKLLFNDLQDTLIKSSDIRHIDLVHVRHYNL